MFANFQTGRFTPQNSTTVNSFRTNYGVTKWSYITLNTKCFLVLLLNLWRLVCGIRRVELARGCLLHLSRTRNEASGIGLCNWYRLQYQRMEVQNHFSGFKSLFTGSYKVYLANTEIIVGIACFLMVSVYLPEMETKRALAPTWVGVLREMLSTS